MKRVRLKASGSRLSMLALFAVLALALAGPAAACPVCAGGEGSNMTTGMNNGILTLLGVIGLVQVGFVGLFGSIWYRTRKLRKHREQFHLIEGEQ